jgi:molybdopterin-guanine dinucleotide biosynthesis protein A
MSINGIVLAGGLSSRMGRDKALLPWQGRTLLEHMRGLLMQAGAERVWVSGDYPTFGGIPDQVARCGPLGGLHSVMQQMPDSQAWVVAVDTPLLAPGLLQRLAGEGLGACTIFDGHPFPMLLTVDYATRSVLAAMLDDAEGPRSVQAFQRRLQMHVLALESVDEACLVNCNTPEQWEDVAS